MVKKKEESSHKLEFTKHEDKQDPYGGIKRVSETFEVPDARDQYRYKNSVSTELSDEVNFQEAVKDDSAQELIKTRGANN